MEKMEVEKKFEDNVIDIPVEEVVVHEHPKGTKWIKNIYEGTKQCESCGCVMRGWAYREPFQYCPKCGAMAEKAE